MGTDGSMKVTQVERQRFMSSKTDASRSPKAANALSLMDQIAKRRMAEQGTDWMPSITIGSPQWAAWRQWRIANDLPVVFMDKQGSAGKAWTVCQDWPPS